MSVVSLRKARPRAGGFAHDAYFNHTDSTLSNNQRCVARYHHNPSIRRADQSDGIMDWTGGTRRRFTGARNSNTALKKQKAHFAKARAASKQDPVASRSDILPPSRYNLSSPMGALDVQNRKRTRGGANDRRAIPRVTSSRGM